MIKIRLIFKIVLIFVFLVGGLFQFFGLLSNTISTILISAVFLMLGLSGRAKKNIEISVIPYIILFTIIVISAFINGTKSIFLLLYAFSFALVPFSIWKFIATRIVDKIDFAKLIKLFIFVGIIQLPVLLIQQTFGAQMVMLSVRPLAPEDVAFGTFFFANDHGLCFFILSMILYLLYDKNGIVHKRRWFLVIWFSFTIVIANSNISFLLLLIVLVGYIIPRLKPQGFFLALTFSLMVGISFLLFPSLGSMVIEKYEHIEMKLIATGDNTWDDAQTNIEKGMPERSDILMYYQMQEFKYIGDGPYTYFDPLLGKFVLFKNFSQYLWFYNDLGIIGVISVLIVYLNFYFANCKLFDYKLYFLILIVVYAFFANTLSDLSFNIIFALFLLKDSKQRKNNSNEHSLHSIPRLA